MGLNEVPDADAETTATVMTVIEELFSLCPLHPKPAVLVKALEHVSMYDPLTDTIYIFIPEDSYPISAKEVLEPLRRPSDWSSFLSEIVEEYVHAYQERLNEEPSDRAKLLWRKYYSPSWGKGHGPDFFEAAIRFAAVLKIDDASVVSTIASRVASDYSKSSLSDTSHGN